jgi:hypothetical protein
MKIHVATTNQKTLEVWRSIIRIPIVEFTSTVPPQLTTDAILMAGQFAFDRYGGRPQSSDAQILQNKNGDGMPPFIIIPPYRPMVKNPEGGRSVAPGWEDVSPAYHAVSRALEGIKSWNLQEFDTPHHIESIVIDLAMLGMNNSSDTRTPASVHRALAEFYESQ